ncbi:Putative protein in type-1 retrotransposable element R1DM [Araneus ventricosus]|uniref:RNase H type-1 domain-containing protein n=1 Tax=Araneus ventricosus TaxID=182803 RepID=A0A4Y2W9H5_ARAVE|nr:Putative protein in type-1 retrotransposable element R1DM [Araneus ventricosus]
MVLLRVLQINVNHSRAAHGAAFDTAETQNFDFVCVQDPHLVDGFPLGVALGFPIFSSIRLNCSIYFLNSNLNFSLKHNTLNSVSILIYFHNLTITLTNLYFQPHDNFDELILEISDIGKDNSCNLLIGVFNARSQIWGYGFEDHRGRVLSEFLTLNNFSICNRTDLGPTFNSSTGHGFPDLSLISTAHQYLLDAWRIDNSDSLSDHKLICVQLAGDFSFSHDFIFKTKFSLNKFSHRFRKDLVFLKNLVTTVSSIEGIDLFYKTFMDLITKAAFGTFQKKPLRHKKIFSVWNDTLRVKRNRVTALYRKYNSLKKNDAPGASVLAAGIIYRKERSELKKLINTTKRKAWEILCLNYNSKFGHTFKVAFSKLKRNYNLDIKIPNNSNPSIAEKAKCMLTHFFPFKDLSNFNKLSFPFQSLNCINILDLEDLFTGLKGGRAPGLDRIDYRTWTKVFEMDKFFFCDFINLCSRFSYFPSCLKNAKFFFLLKPGRDCSIISSYRPICLLPTLGKLIERLFIKQFNSFIIRHNLIHQFQFGFRELSNCEVAVNSLISKIRASREGNHVALVSIDIRAAFDSLDWEAYADDLALLVVADSRKKLETEVSSFLVDLSDNLKVLNLEVASEKTLVVVFRGTQNKNKQKKGLVTFKRTPIFKIKGRTIRTVDSLKYLGIYIDNQLNWNEHISNLKIKIYNLIQNFHSVSGPNWGAGASLLKHWYLSVIQPALLFGAAVWGGSFTKQQILSLFSVQRVALIKISKCYRTCPTNALNVFLVLPSLHVVACSLFIKFQIWYDRSNEYDFINVDHLDHFIKINHINLNKRIITFPPLIKNPDFDIYTDGSGIDGNVGAAVCIFKNNILSQSFQFKLSNYNSVFQAELAAINFAVGWALEGGFKVNIYTDSYSYIQVLKKSDVKSGFINDIKSNVFRALGSVGLSWVKAHAGIPGNELADQFAKSAITEGNFLDIPAPYSFLKKCIKNIILSDWQQHWGESDTGVRVREYVPFVDFNLLTHNRYLLFFISGHGPFPAYLFRFKILNSPNCICGGRTTSCSTALILRIFI